MHRFAFLRYYYCCPGGRETQEIASKFVPRRGVLESCVFHLQLHQVGIPFRFHFLCACRGGYYTTTSCFSSYDIHVRVPLSIFFWLIFVFSLGVLPLTQECNWIPPSVITDLRVAVRTTKKTPVTAIPYVPAVSSTIGGSSRGCDGLYHRS